MFSVSKSHALSCSVYLYFCSRIVKLCEKQKSDSQALYCSLPSRIRRVARGFKTARKTLWFEKSVFWKFRKNDFSKVYFNKIVVWGPIFVVTTGEVEGGVVVGPKPSANHVIHMSPEIPTLGNAKCACFLILSYSDHGDLWPRVPLKSPLVASFPRRLRADRRSPALWRHRFLCRQHFPEDVFSQRLSVTSRT